MENLATLVAQLWRVGIDRIFINGSFVEAKPHPNDIDGYFECDEARVASGELEASLNAVDPSRAWGWSRRRFDPDSGKMQLFMWHRYRVELYPHFDQLCNIFDEFGHNQRFPAAFRKTRDTYRPKGIVQLLQSAHPAIQTSPATGGSR